MCRARSCSRRGQIFVFDHTFRMLFETAAECERVKIFAVEANEQNFDRLEAELAKMR
jgi:hypothetical protein